MAESITVKSNDTVTGILMSKRGLTTHEVHSWTSKVRRMNPHIIDLNRIFPGDMILIPDTLHEAVPEHQIWNNTFNQIPASLTQRSINCGHTLYITGGGETIVYLAEKMFAGSHHQNLPQSAKPALLLHNNPALKRFSSDLPIPMATVVNITPVRLSEYDRREWEREQPYLGSQINMLDELSHSPSFQERVCAVKFQPPV